MSPYLQDKYNYCQLQIMCWVIPFMRLQLSRNVRNYQSLLHQHIPHNDASLYITKSLLSLESVSARAVVSLFFNLSTSTIDHLTILLYWSIYISQFTACESVSLVFHHLYYGLDCFEHSIQFLYSSQMTKIMIFCEHWHQML